jgi:transketolase C-terminal domain/subunit
LPGLDHGCGPSHQATDDLAIMRVRRTHGGWDPCGRC